VSNNIVDVQPIRNLEDIDRMKWALRKFCTERDYILFSLGINTGLRASDLLRIERKQILDIKTRKKKELVMYEKKTGKRISINIKNIYPEVLAYAESINSEWLFPSRKGDKPISVTQAYRVLNKGAYWAELDSIGTHTMRKTFGYHLYKRTRDVALLQRILNHSSPTVTLRYIGINQEEVDNVLESFIL